MHPSDKVAPAPPKVWAVLCYREGDNSQILALAEALGWPCEVKRLAYRKLGYASDVWRGTTLAGIDRAASSPLEPPWPDLVISAAMRNEPVCRWIQQQAGKRVRYVHIGRPWARLRWFDLLVTMPEFRIPDRPNVLNNGLSLCRITEDGLAEAAASWAPAFAHLPRPHVAVLVGGYGGPYALGIEAAHRLGRIASDMARRQGGSLLVTTSHRTRPEAADALAAAIDVPAHIHRWRRRATDNPYRGYLAHADAFIVTCDSASMLTEACATRKPVYMFDLGPAGRRVGRDLDGPPAPRPTLRCRVDGLKATLYRHLIDVPPQRMTRDIRLVHRYLLDSGRVVRVGEAFPDRRPPPLGDLSQAASRVRALFEPQG
ncbi:MAG: ELM1/GtrOC1 family putative glycosyltransferase [Dongiaceae bacterium]